MRKLPHFTDAEIEAQKAKEIAQKIIYWLTNIL